MTAGCLVARDVRMAFGGVVALDHVGVEVHPGRVTGLIGRNGSGKSTLFNCLTGFLLPTAGRIELDGRDITGQSPHQLVGAGLARTFQTPRIDFHTTARDAVLCGLYPRARQGFLASLVGWPAALQEERRLRAQADALIERLRMQDWADLRIDKLSMGRVRTVEVARALAGDTRYLLLDEPAAGLGRDEIAVLADEIRAVAARGIGVLLVEHNFGLIRQLCDDVTVLDSGSVIFRGTPEQARRDARVMQQYLGAAAAEALP